MSHLSVGHITILDIPKHAKGLEYDDYIKSMHVFSYLGLSLVNAAGQKRTDHLPASHVLSRDSKRLPETAKDSIRLP